MSSIVTVTVPATSFNLTTAAAVRAELGIESDDNIWINLKLPRASAAIARYCDRIFAQQTYSETFRNWCDDPFVVSLRERPIVSITSIIEDGTTLATTDYELDAETGNLYRISDTNRTSWRASVTTVVYVAGFVLPGDNGTRTLPFDIEDAAIEMMRSAYEDRQRNPALKSVAIPGVISETYWVSGPSDQPGTLPSGVTALLNPHRRMYI